MGGMPKWGAVDLTKEFTYSDSIVFTKKAVQKMLNLTLQESIHYRWEVKLQTTTELT